MDDLEVAVLVALELSLDVLELFGEGPHLFLRRPAAQSRLLRAFLFVETLAKVLELSGGGYLSGTGGIRGGEIGVGEEIHIGERKGVH